MGAMTTPSPSPERDKLYLVSCRKTDPQAGDRRRMTANFDLDFHAPKRAGTFLLAEKKVGAPEGDVTVLDDTDAGENPNRLSQLNQQKSWTDQQRAAEDRIAQQLLRLGPMVLYVHGFNTVPNEAAQAAVRVQRYLDSLQVGATVVLFTWPSMGHLLDYFPDQMAAGRFGSYALVNLLMSLARNANTTPVHCLAHSMGTYVTTRALSTIATLHLELSLPAGRKLLAQVAFMQPDIDYDLLCSGYAGPQYDSPSYLEIPDGYAATEMVERLTIYCSTNDVALFASLFKNRSKRLGAYGPGLEGEHDLASLMAKRIRPNVEVVNCDDWELLDPMPYHSHSRFLDCQPIMADVARVLTSKPSTGAPNLTQLISRWYRLDYLPAPHSPSPGILKSLAAFWGAVGNVAINPTVTFLVKGSKLVQQTLRVTGWFIPIGGVAVTIFGISVSRSQGHTIVRSLLWVIAVAVAVYVLTWIRGRAVQKHEDTATPVG